MKKKTLVKTPLTKIKIDDDCWWWSLTMKITLFQVHRGGVSGCRWVLCPHRRAHLDHRPNWWNNQLCSCVSNPPSGLLHDDSCHLYRCVSSYPANEWFKHIHGILVSVLFIHPGHSCICSQVSFGGYLYRVFYQQTGKLKNRVGDLMGRLWSRLCEAEHSGTIFKKYIL